MQKSLPIILVQTKKAYFYHFLKFYWKLELDLSVNYLTLARKLLNCQNNVK